MLDTSLIVAALDDREAMYLPARALIENEAGALYIQPLVIAEATYFAAERNHLAELALLLSIYEGSFIPLSVLASDWARIIDLVRTYRDLPLGTTDAATVAIAERQGITRIATFDQDFAIVRPRHTEHFELLP